MPEREIHLHVHDPADTRRFRRLEELITETAAELGLAIANLHAGMETGFRRLYRLEQRQGTEQMVAYADLLATVERSESVQVSVRSLLTNLAAELREALDNGDDAQIAALITRIESQSDQTAAAVVANTVASTEPAPPPAEGTGETPPEPDATV